MATIGRRRFLQASAAAGVLAARPAWAAPLRSPVSGGEGGQSEPPFRLAVIGHMYNAGHFFTSMQAYPDVELVAVSDPEEGKLAPVFRDWETRAAGSDAASAACRRLLERKPAVYSDFRKLLAEKGEGIDGVVVSLFDNLHGPICGAAMRAGKAVFSERPLGLTIREARALRALAAEKKVATSIRNPGNASNAFRRAVELIREGAIGKVEDVHVWFPRAGQSQKEAPKGTPAVPAGLDWDVWLGPAAARPYHPDWMGYAQWRDFSNGAVGTFGPHAANLAFLSLRVRELWDAPGATISVRAEVPELNRIGFPRWERVRWEVPARGALPPVRFTWHFGPAPGLAPGSRELLEKLLRERGLPAERREAVFKEAGALILGSDGAVLSDSHNAGVTFLPTAQDLKGPKSLSASKGHYRDWILAARGGPAAWASFDYAGPFSEFLMLANVATQVEGELRYDPAAGKIVNSEEADRLLGRPYREGWTL